MAISERQLLDAFSRMPFIDSAELARILGEPHATVHGHPKAIRLRMKIPFVSTTENNESTHQKQLIPRRHPGLPSKNWTKRDVILETCSPTRFPPLSV